MLFIFLLLVFDFNILKVSPAFSNNHFSITGIGRCPIADLELLEELLLQSPNNCPNTTNILREHELFLYLREVGVKY